MRRRSLLFWKKNSEPNNVITYYASSKLAEITSDSYNGGVRMNAFDSQIVSHTFSDGVGTITFASDVSVIGSYAFAYTTNLTNIILPKTITTLKNHAFRNCSGLVEIDLSGYENLQRIEAQAFNFASTSNKVLIPSNVTYIGDYGFSGNTRTEIYIYAVTPPSIGTMIFELAWNSSIYVPSQSINAYKAATGWASYAPIIKAIPEGGGLIKKLLYLLRKKGGRV